MSDLQITSKLMLLRAGASNFRTIGAGTKEEPYHVIDFTENNNLLISSTDNGSGKSSLYIYLPYFMMTGESFKKGDLTDSLVSSLTNKNMKCFLEWHFAGTYYRCERGRKPNVFDIFTKVDDAWVEIPDLPVSARDRQDHLYSLFGLERSTAKIVIENTLLLGVQKYLRFLSMTTEQRRNLIEPIFDLGIFSEMNKEAKAERGNLLTEQKQVYADISNLDKKVALEEQSVMFTKQELLSLESESKARKEGLEVEVSDCKLELEKASEVDTSGSELHQEYEKSCDEITEEKKGLKVKLEQDLKSLGEFEIDPNDKVLVNLEASYLSVDYEISVAKKELKDKEASLEGDVKKVIASKREELESLEEDYQSTIKQSEEDYELENDVFIYSEREYNILLEEYKKLKIAKEETLGNLQGGFDKLQKEVTEKEQLSDKYQENIRKLKDVESFLQGKIEVEEGNLNNLTSVGECPTCKQHVSEDWIVSLKESIQEKLDKLLEEKQVYTDRILSGETKVQELGVSGLQEKCFNLEQDIGIVKNDIQKFTDRITETSNEILNLQTKREVFEKECSSKSEKLESEYKLNKKTLESVINEAELKAKESLGECLSKYNNLVETADSRKANIKQQIEDRKLALKGEYGGKETHLKQVFDVEMKALEDKANSLKIKLKDDLQKLVDNKEKLVSDKIKLLQKAVYKLQEFIANSTKKELALISKLKAQQEGYKVISDKLQESREKHDQLQLDIEDYDKLLIILSDQHGKGDVITHYLPRLNKSINKYLAHMNLFINVEMDNVFKLTMLDEARKNQTLYSLSEGESSKVNLAIMLALREVAQGNNSCNSNLLVLDEVLENLNNTSVVDCVEMLKGLFSELNLIVVTQRGEEFAELFDNHKSYSKINGVTKEIETN